MRRILIAALFAWIVLVPVNPAIQDAEVFFPRPPTGLNASLAGTSLITSVIDASGEKFSWLYPVMTGCTIDRVYVRLGTVAQTSTIRISIQDTSLTTGDADGTQDQYRDLSVGTGDSNTVVSTGLITSDGTDGGSKRTTSRGDLIHFVAEFPSFAAGDSVQLANPQIAVRSGVVLAAYASLFTASWTKFDNRIPAISVECSGGVFNPHPTVLPAIAGFTTHTFNSSSTPDEIALRFSVPYKARVGGAWFALDLDANADVVLYDGTTALQTTSLDSDVRPTTVALPGAIQFPASQELTAGGTYRLAIKPTTTSNITAVYLETSTAAQMGQLAGGADVYWSERTDAGSWSDTTTRRPLLGLFIDGLDNGAGGSGSGGAYVVPQ